ncbi:MinD superfamily P-loop ATPase containing an inserted ferredoxin domain [[Clostridium] ultunense Esp]|uniref:MinD superfamily P-loop ATPase containing an inserted ferredoxin domain n=1 Tax=[Clostridium] ultunense Esp TaxID=1288971 RepID=M1ZFK5_9FIRM|nr:ATP-binding protein [Schnuerera ultunensis]CCQ97516.1 MinD superfamily P-loop ATPase containing an inserted ferredoxin domain [[Clostridium] ultunense Esp]SHD76122.1 MinD superfamily P-loop ATPase containing an inserted ferredoxin domain [[Clostridium] ultunense Esp]
MKLGIISGKGGTGKTTIAISIAELEKGSISIDADVDASNMFLYYDGEDIDKEYFSGSEIAQVDSNICTQCGQCNQVCKFDAIDMGKVNPLKCEGCGACQIICPVDAINLVEQKTADIYETQTPIGKIFRADMEIGGDGSGLLVSRLRKKAEKHESKSGVTILDGSPGIGCAVIASITNNDLVLIVTEPTKSGKEDFIRVHQLTEHFGIDSIVCINKYDINEDMSLEIENYCKEEEIPVVGKIPFDEEIVESINSLKPIIYYEDSKANLAIREMWKTIKEKYINF